MKSTTARTGWTRTPFWQFLSAEAYWSRWRSRDDVQRQIQGAWRVVGCYDGQGHMVGFARALSDGVALAYLADVYVLENHRGRGLGRALLQEMIEDGPGKEFRWLLHTADAHGLYRQFGFTAPDATIMERASRRPTATNPPGAKPLVPPLLGQCAAPGRPAGSGLVPSRERAGSQQGTDRSPAGTAANAPPGGASLACGNHGSHQGSKTRRDRTGQARAGEKAEGPEPGWSREVRSDGEGASVAVDGSGLLVQPVAALGQA